LAISGEKFAGMVQRKDDMELKRAEIVLLLYLFGNWQPRRVMTSEGFFYFFALF
jgi:hypothetical protein